MCDNTVATLVWQFPFSRSDLCSYYVSPLVAKSKLDTLYYLFTQSLRSRRVTLIAKTLTDLGVVVEICNGIFLEECIIVFCSVYT